MLLAINEIESYFEPGKKLFTAYKSDIKTKRAIERDMEIIGEAANRIIKINPDFQLSNIREIIGTRNRIIHGYDTVSDEMIWSIVINHIPKLRDEVEELLDQS